LTLTTLYKSGGNGITYPSNAGVFMVSLAFYSSDSGSKTFADSRYIEVYPASFTSMIVKGYIPFSGETNPIEVKFQSSVSLGTSHYLVIEIPTKTGGFSDDVGLGITYDGQAITYDEITATPKICIFLFFLKI